MRPCPFWFDTPFPLQRRAIPPLSRLQYCTVPQRVKKSSLISKQEEWQNVPVDDTHVGANRRRSAWNDVRNPGHIVSETK